MFKTRSKFARAIGFSLLQVMALHTFADTCISTVAGTGSAYTYNGDGIPATTANLNQPRGVTIDPGGNFYIAEYSGCRIRKVDSSGNITTVAGTGIPSYSGDGGPGLFAEISEPQKTAIGPDGAIYIADSYNQVVRRLDPATGLISTFAGTGAFGYSGDGGPATSAKLYFPSGVAFDSFGNLYIADYSNNVVRKVSPGGIISTFGGGSDSILDVAVDSADNVYFIVGNTVRKIPAGGGANTLVAGVGLYGFSGDGGPATAAYFDTPRGLGFDAANNIYIADYYNSRIRRVDAITGIITTVVGTGTWGYSGDLGQASLARLNRPADVSFATNGDMYIADTYNNAIRKVGPCDPSWSPSPSRTISPSPTFTLTFTSSPTFSMSPTITATPTPSGTRSATATISVTASHTPSGTPSATPTASPTLTLVLSGTPTSGLTPSPSPTCSGTATPSASPSSSPSATPTMSISPSISPSMSATPTNTGTLTWTLTATPSPSFSPSFSMSPTFSISPTYSVSPTQSLTWTPRPAGYGGQASLIEVHDVYPNPFAGKAHVYFTLRVDARIRVAIYNVAGERIFDKNADGIAGQNDYIWDGTNDDGNRCASGAYLLQLTATGVDQSTGSFWAAVAIAR